jgi:hypothetical protein
MLYSPRMTALTRITSRVRGEKDETTFTINDGDTHCEIERFNIAMLKLAVVEQPRSTNQWQLQTGFVKKAHISF